MFAQHRNARWNLIRIDHAEMDELCASFPGESYPVVYAIDPFRVWPNAIEGITYSVEQKDTQT